MPGREPSCARLLAKPISARRPGSRIACRPPGSRRFRLRPGEQVRLAIEGLTAKTLEVRSAPYAGEFSQGRGRGAIAAGGQEGSRLPAVEPTFKFHNHIRPNPSHPETPRKTREL